MVIQSLDWKKNTNKGTSQIRMKEVNMNITFEVVPPGPNAKFILEQTNAILGDKARTVRPWSQYVLVAGSFIAIIMSVVLARLGMYAEASLCGVLVVTNVIGALEVPRASWEKIITNMLTLIARVKTEKEALSNAKNAQVIKIEEEQRLKQNALTEWNKAKQQLEEQKKEYEKVSTELALLKKEQEDKAKLLQQLLADAEKVQKNAEAAACAKTDCQQHVHKVKEEIGVLRATYEKIAGLVSLIKPTNEGDVKALQEMTQAFGTKVSELIKDDKNPNALKQVAALALENLHLLFYAFKTTPTAPATATEPENPNLGDSMVVVEKA